MVRAVFAAAALAAASVIAAPPSNADAMSDLMGMLGGGYGPDTCFPAVVPPRAALASVDCGPLPGGPTLAKFAIFPDQQAVANEWNASVDTIGPVPCPGKTRAGVLHSPAGILVCGTQPDGPRVMYTVNDELRIGIIKGPSLEVLFDWLGLEH